jgi:hypothetical protein
MLLVFPETHVMEAIELIRLHHSTLLTDGQRFRERGARFRHVILKRAVVQAVRQTIEQAQLATQL